MEEQMSFEQAMTQLEEIVHRLEAGNLPLSDMVVLYEEGMTLCRQCGEKLDAFSAKIDVLNGTAQSEPLEDL